MREGAGATTRPHVWVQTGDANGLLYNVDQDAGSVTFPLHAHGQALLIAAVLAAVALAFVHQTLFVVPAGVAQVFAHSPFKETFTALAAVNAVVFP